MSIPSIAGSWYPEARDVEFGFIQHDAAIAGYLKHKAFVCHLEGTFDGAIVRFDWHTDFSWYGAVESDTAELALQNQDPDPRFWRMAGTLRVPGREPSGWLLQRLEALTGDRYQRMIQETMRRSAERARRRSRSSPDPEQRWPKAWRDHWDAHYRFLEGRGPDPHTSAE